MDPRIKSEDEGGVEHTCLANMKRCEKDKELLNCKKPHF